MERLLPLVFIFYTFYSHSLAQTHKTQIVLLGSDHFNQIYKKEFPNTDILLPERQKEIVSFTNLIESIILIG